jgi:hypothetical protein
VLSDQPIALLSYSRMSWELSTVRANPSLEARHNVGRPS